jgi:hypothetical protein
VSVNISNLSKIKRNESFSFKGEEGTVFSYCKIHSGQGAVLKIQRKEIKLVFYDRRIFFTYVGKISLPLLTSRHNKNLPLLSLMICKCLRGKRRL